MYNISIYHRYVHNVHWNTSATCFKKSVFLENSKLPPPTPQAFKDDFTVFVHLVKKLVYLIIRRKRTILILLQICWTIPDCIFMTHSMILYSTPTTNKHLTFYVNFSSYWKILKPSLIKRFMNVEWKSVIIHVYEQFGFKTNCYILHVLVVYTVFKTSGI